MSHVNIKVYILFFWRIKVYIFDVTKADKIFEIWLKEKQLKLTNDHRPMKSMTRNIVNYTMWLVTPLMNISVSRIWYDSESNKNRKIEFRLAGNRTWK